VDGVKAIQRSMQFNSSEVSAPAAPEQQSRVADRCASAFRACVSDSKM